MLGWVCEFGIARPAIEIGEWLTGEVWRGARRACRRAPPAANLVHLEQLAFLKESGHFW